MKLSDRHGFPIILSLNEIYFSTVVYDLAASHRDCADQFERM